MRTVACSCGYVASGETAGELLADGEAHIEAAHCPNPAVPAATATVDRTGSTASDVPTTPIGPATTPQAITLLGGAR
jgi:hypothetical protein